MNNTIVIIGGMGPQASAEALQRVVRKATDRSRELHVSFPQIVVLSLPVPDFIADTKNIEPAFSMIESEAQKALPFNPRVTMIACNTAHLLFERLQSSIPGIGLHSLIAAAVDEAKNRNMRTIALLASPTTIKTKLYQNLFEQAGIACRVPDEDQLRKLESMIQDTINRTSFAHKAQLRSMVSQFLEDGCDGVLLGCTELPLIFGSHGDHRIIDSMDVLSDTLVDKYFQKSDIMEER